MAATLAVDLFCGLGGWTEGLLAEGYICYDWIWLTSRRGLYLLRLDMAYKARPVADRFWEKVEKSDGCWLWTACKPGFGYGKFVVKKGESPRGAHRLAYEFEVGPIPPGMQVLHRCDNPSCVRPSHLFLGTQKDNVRDCRNKGRWKYKPRNQSGENNPNSILSDAQVASMLAELSAGGRPVSVARKYDIAYKTLWAIRHRKATSH